MPAVSRNCGYRCVRPRAGPPPHRGSPELPTAWHEIALHGTGPRKQTASQRNKKIAPLAFELRPKLS